MQRRREGEKWERRVRKRKREIRGEKTGWGAMPELGQFRLIWSTGLNVNCISYGCLTIKGSHWFAGVKLLIWSFSSRESSVCISSNFDSDIKLSANSKIRLITRSHQIEGTKVDFSTPMNLVLLKRAIKQDDSSMAVVVEMHAFMAWRTLVQLKWDNPGHMEKQHKPK